ncbi:hypothetical protein LWM68_15865 [Niabella sp. W65]|nr:hypothetical protein [Niabella sp. W65]MCH7364102.1 hypothetical protein [Niabella sp. W65]ULT39979.1 hypothetical protein KRR40_34690 [Niabella sp. I65]
MWNWAIAAAAVVTVVFFVARIFNSTNTGGHPQVENLASTSADSSAPVAVAPPEIKTEPPVILPGNVPQPVDRYAGNTPLNDNIASRPAVTPGSLSSSVTAATTTPGIIQRPPSVISAPAQVHLSPQMPNQAAQQTPPANVDFWKNKAVPNTTTITNNPPPYKTEEKQLVMNAPKLTDKPRKEKNSKWQPSLYVSPLLGDLGIDMGYGVALGYAINDKIKISSGVAYSKLSASRNYGADPVGAMMASAISNGSNNPQGPIGATGAAGATGIAEAAGRPSLDSKAALTSAYNFVAGSQMNSLQQVDGSLSGIDIPVEINYNISKKLYASAGVSGLVVINDNKKYTYVDNRNVKVSVETSRGNLKEDKSVLFSEQSTTNQPLQAPKENIPF